MDTSDEWIEARTGIKQRHFARDGQGPSDLAVEASKQALDDAGLDASDIDYIIFATMTPDYFFPGSGPLLGAKLGISGIPALDIRQQCAAIPYALQLANALVHSGAAKTILLVGAEVHAGFMPWSDWDLVRSEAEGQASPEAYERANQAPRPGRGLRRRRRCDGAPAKPSGRRRFPRRRAAQRRETPSTICTFRAVGFGAFLTSRRRHCSPRSTFHRCAVRPFSRRRFKHSRAP